MKKNKKIDLSKYSNKKIILGIYALTLICLFLVGADGYLFGSVIGAYVQMSVMTLLFMVIPALPLSIYSRLTKKTFFLSEKMIKFSFSIGLSLAFLFVITFGEVMFNLGHIVASICLAIGFFRKNPDKK